MAEIRRASESDVPAIGALLKIYSDRKIVLPRSEDDIRSHLKNFTVAYLDGRLAGCMALRDFGGRLFEVRSLAVQPEFQGRGIGGELVRSGVARLQADGEPFRLFTLTYQREFFRKAGFEVTDRHFFPEKIWSDCAQCPKHACCDETAMIYGGAQ